MVSAHLDQLGVSDESCGSVDCVIPLGVVSDLGDGTSGRGSSSRSRGSTAYNTSAEVGGSHLPAAGPGPVDSWLSSQTAAHARGDHRSQI